MNSDIERLPAKPTGRRYASVSEMLDGEGVGQEVKAQVAEIENETKVVAQLSRLRQRAGITQEEIAQHLGSSQSAVSKLESSRDDDLTLREIKGYAKATGQRIGVLIGKPPTHVEAVKAHALAIKSHLEALARIANHHTDLEKDIKAFFGEAFFNILDILGACGEQLPKAGGGVEVRVEVSQVSRQELIARAQRGRGTAEPMPA